MPSKLQKLALVISLTTTAGLIALLFALLDEQQGRFSARAIQAPWMVMISGSDNNPDFICSGALINKQWVLTAAHCLEDQTVMVTAAKDIENHVPYSEVSAKIILHPSTKGYEWDEEKIIRHTDDLPVDLGLIKLKHPLQSDVLALSAKQPSQTDGQLWGYGPEEGLENLELQRSPAEGEECNEHNQQMICVSSDLDQSPRSCQGDSGGPMVASDHNQPRLVAVVSTLEISKDLHCTPVGWIGKLGWHIWLTPIQPYLGWIKDTISKN